MPKFTLSSVENLVIKFIFLLVIQNFIVSSSNSDYFVELIVCLRLKINLRIFNAANKACINSKLLKLKAQA